jgi:hypothetical protein
MSPRAASQLEQIGFIDVYDYVPGKVDWFANGLPREGASAKVRWVGDVAAAEGFPTALPDDRIGELRATVDGSGYDFCVVLDDQRIVLGVLHGDALAKDPSVAAMEVMELGPRTTRPNNPIEALLRAKSSQGVKGWLVTTPHGALLGVLRRTEAERAVEWSRPQDAG